MRSMKAKGLCYLLVIAANWVIVYCSKKQWLRNTNYDNPRNWDAGRLPCPTDTIRFPDPSPAVYLATGIGASQLILPSNGQFMLADGFSISAVADGAGEGSVTSQGHSTVQSVNGTEVTCNGSSEVQFNRTEPEDWFNPDNWCELSQDNTCLDPQPARLDTEKVPCAMDDVLFPPRSTFLVQIASPTPVKVKSLQIAGRTRTLDDLQSFLESEAGQRQFKFINDTSLEADNRKCQDSTGCPCGNDKGVVMNHICSLKTPSCKSHLCDAPLLPKGQCCVLCGAVIIADYTYGFVFKKFQRRLILKFLSEDTKIVFSKSSTDRIQLVIGDDSDGEKAKRRGDEIYSFLKDDIRRKKSLGLSNVQLQTSGKGIYAAAVKSKPNDNRVASIVGIIITIVILILLIALAMYCFVDRGECRRLRDKMPSAITFRRFSTADGGAGGESLEMGDSVSYIDIMNRLEHQTTFDNPMYGVADKFAPPTGEEQEKEQEKEGDDARALNNNVVNSNDSPAVLDASSVTFTHDKAHVPRTNSFSNPLFGEKLTDYKYVDATVKINPVFNADDIDDSSI